MEKTMDSTTAKIQGIASILVATIIAIGLIVAAVILAGGDYGRDQVQCTSVMSTGSTKAMSSDMEIDVIIQSGAEVGTQSARYNYDSNTLLITTANISGSRQANVAIDYDRSVVFIEILGESDCLASALRGEMMNMADRFTNFMSMTDRRQEAINIATARTVVMRYNLVGPIPSGYVTITNGPTIRGLCAGDVTQWTEERGAGSGRKRRSVSGMIQICIFGFCFTISF